MEPKFSIKVIQDKVFKQKKTKMEVTVIKGDVTKLKCLTEEVSLVT